MDGAACDVLAVSYKGADSRLWVNDQGRVVKQTYQGNNPMTRTPGQFEVFYSDYRTQDGRQIPFKEVIKIDGDEAMTLPLEKFEVNPQVETALFEKPGS